MRILATAMAQHGGDRDTARLLWTTTYHTTQDSMIRKNALEHLRALKVDDDVEQLEDILAEYRRQFGRTARDFRDLIAIGALRGVPVDPLGYPYTLNAQGEVRVQHPEELPFITRGVHPEKEPFLPFL